MMKKLRRLAPTEHARELDLPASRREQVVAADHQRHALHVIVDGRRELIRPVAVAILDEQIAALRRRLLLLRPMAEIDEPLNRIVEPHAQADAAVFAEAALAAGARIPGLLVRSS